MCCGACAGASARCGGRRFRVAARRGGCLRGAHNGQMARRCQNCSRARRTPARTQITHPDDAPAPWRVLCAVAVAARAMSPALLRLLRVLSAFNCSTRRAAGGAHHVQRVSVSLWLLFAARANGQFFVNFPQVSLQVLLDGPPSAKLAAGFAGLCLAGFASFLACFSLTSSLRRRRSSRRRLGRQ